MNWLQQLILWLNRRYVPPAVAPPPGDMAVTMERLNGLREAEGRGPVGWDAELAADSDTNNGLQRSRGMGHWYLGRALGQCAAMAPSLDQCLTLWEADPPHRAILVGNYTRCGIAYDGRYATLDMR